MTETFWGRNDWTGWYRSDCRHPAEPVFRIGEAEIFAGRPGELGARIDADLGAGRTVVLHDLAGELSRGRVAPVSIAGTRLPGVDRLLLPPLTVVRVHWQDGGVPPLPPAWWQRLVDWIGTTGGRHYVTCIGGHGRTGTWLAIVGALAGAVDRADPIGWVRANYCTRTVETAVQIRYVAAVLGLPESYAAQVAPAERTVVPTVRTATPPVAPTKKGAKEKKVENNKVVITDTNLRQVTVDVKARAVTIGVSDGIRQQEYWRKIEKGQWFDDDDNPVVVEQKSAILQAVLQNAASLPAGTVRAVVVDPTEPAIEVEITEPTRDAYAACFFYWTPVDGWRNEYDRPVPGKFDVPALDRLLDQLVELLGKR